MAQILAVGIATLDIVNEVDTYPDEDTEVRALTHSVRRGGNATNTLVVLTQLGHCCTWGGVLPDGPAAAVVVDELARYRIDTRYCRRLPEGSLPTSYITLSRDTGSRTIVHVRNLPEYDADSFSRIPLQDFDWLHFEGRNVEQVLLMMQRARKLVPCTPVSLEVEKPRQHIERLFPCADLLLFSHAFARQRQLPAAELLRQVRPAAPQADLVCSCGPQGAVGLRRAGPVVKVEAFRPQRVADTLGAGDTFNAGVIDALQRSAALPDAMRFGTQLAGAKCAQTGLHGLSIPLRSGSGHGEAGI
jgi:ketohexokinase